MSTITILLLDDDTFQTEQIVVGPSFAQLMQTFQDGSESSSG